MQDLLGGPPAARWAPGRIESARRDGVCAVLGPTNTGKTHHAIERMLSFRTGMIGLPLRLARRGRQLLFEVISCFQDSLGFCFQFGAFGLQFGDCPG